MSVCIIENGGVTAPLGFKAAGLHCGIRKNTEKKDLALIVADVDCAAAAVYTTNLVKAAPIYVTKRHLANGTARAIIVNSGNANACTHNDTENAEATCRLLAEAIGIDPTNVIVNSTGVIGQPLPVQRIEAAIPSLVAALSKDGGDDAAAAIMTTDLTKKQIAVSFSLGGKTVTIGAMAKGSGMIHPNMATMLSFITTDCAISATMLQEALSRSVRRSYNRISVDGDTSTNDMTAIMASGLSGNPCIETADNDFAIFLVALDMVNVHLAKMIAKDGEGATKLVCCHVAGAKDEDTAVQLAKSVITSNLVKTMMAGADANVGRVLCAMGYAGAAFNPETVDITFTSDAGTVMVCQNGKGLGFDEVLAKAVLSRDEVIIGCTVRDGDAQADAYGCDLTYEYVRINGDYRS